MKKRLFAVVMSALLVASLGACSAAETSSSALESSVPAVSAVDSEEASETSSEAEPTPEPAVENGFDTFASGLSALGGDWEETPMAADMVGAEEGIKYTSDIGSVELYRFADGAEALSTGTVTLEGFGEMPIEIAGNYGLFLSVENQEDEILSLFQTLSK